MRKLRLYAAAALAGACTALSLTAAPAFAGTASESAPLNSCGSEVCLYNNYNGNITGTLSCVPAINLSFPIFVDVLKNNCDTRVWLHQHPNGSGSTFCVSPHTTATFRGTAWERVPGNIQVSSNPSNC
jgi:hypothetical protein